MAKKKLDPAIMGSMKKAVSDSFADNVKMIDIDNLLESPENFFEVSRIEEFAETILGQGGVKENLIVKPINESEFEIISGHRRTAAVRFLLEKGENISRFLPCLVQNYDDEDVKILDIILMNVSARIITDAQLWKSYEIVNEILQKKKALGDKFGQVQKKLAEILGISTGQAAKLQNIDKRAIDEVKEALEKGDLSINTADKIAKLDKKKQAKLAKEKPLSKLKPKDIEKAEKVITNDNFDDDDDYDEDEDDFDDDNDEDEKVTTNDNFSKKVSSSEKEKKPALSPALAADNLYSFVVENDDIMYEILNAYLEITEDQNERNIISKLKDFMRLARNISEYSDKVTAIFDTYLGVTSDEDEKKAISAIKKYL